MQKTPPPNYAITQITKVAYGKNVPVESIIQFVLGNIIEKCNTRNYISFQVMNEIKKDTHYCIFITFIYGPQKLFPFSYFGPKTTFGLKRDSKTMHQACPIFVQISYSPGGPKLDNQRLGACQSCSSPPKSSTQQLRYRWNPGGAKSRLAFLILTLSFLELHHTLMHPSKTRPSGLTSTLKTS